MILGARRFLEEIKVEHTLFALPFAYAAAFLAARGLPTAHALLWITLAVVGARTAAMASNRLLDARLDAANPRTAGRFVASGALSAQIMLWTIGAGLTLLVVAAWQLNPLALALVPLAAAALLLYPLVKRWTWSVHFVLGAVDGLAPLGAWIAVTGKFTLGGVLLFAAVTLWVAGFDVLYALMDRDFDVREGLRSIPARFGLVASRAVPKVLHACMVLSLALLGFLTGARPLYWLGIALAFLLLVYESRLIAGREDPVALNHAIFNGNMIFSVGFLITTAASVTIP